MLMIRGIIRYPVRPATTATSPGSDAPVKMTRLQRTQARRARLRADNLCMQCSKSRPCSCSGDRKRRLRDRNALR